MKYRIKQHEGGRLFYPQRSEDGVEWEYLPGIPVRYTLENAKMLIESVETPPPPDIYHDYP